MCSSLAAQSSSDRVALEAAVASASPAEKSARWLALSRTLEATDMTRAVDAARQARLAAATPHDQLVASARLCTVLRRRGDYPEAMDLARSELTRADELNDRAALLDLLLVFAQINGSIADYPVAMSAYQRLTQLAEELGHRYMVARGHLGFSVILADTGDRAQARREEEIVIQIARELGDRALEADGLNNLGNNYRTAGEFDRAREAHEQSLALRTAVNNRRGVGDSLGNLAEVAQSRGDCAAALDFAQRALAVYEQLGLKRHLLSARLKIAAALRGLGRTGDSLAQLETGFAAAPAFNSPLLLAEFHHEFSLTHEAMGQPRLALESYRHYTRETERALGEKTRQQIAALRARYEVESRQREAVRRQTELALLDADARTNNAELARANTLRFVFLDGLVLLLIALGGGYLLFRYRVRIERRHRSAPPATDPSAA